MHPHWKSHINYPPIPYPNHNVRTTSPSPHDSHYMMQRMTNLENQLAKLIALIEENNQLIKSMEQQQNQVCAPTGGSVIVRM
ncbi:hypothetical protein [Bacillus pseudomycoides]|uniref:hypothetical protein n=1 Tax=Bacillus pseudomycoides TaxID=64104 RepID=UPI000BEC72F2|nr:hypothetical protein [Bacillus pseudomycoides]PDY46664.1 hypothetical protein CON79_13050 [Bacillus pseudomycoides]PED08175.1 hypothetical protein COO19_11220 [Bacillus pseudomycoides]PED70027.1 hypothetical protein CON97_21275 [Bacillus pseudomycoides]PEE39451.1 hypothetical protein COO02_19040 [Bacillus pseudomycoides]PEI46633.1 hypothetical protein CN620_00750 [Bacillus pseudomycoides]